MSTNTILKLWHRETPESPRYFVDVCGDADDAISLWKLVGTERSATRTDRLIAANVRYHILDADELPESVRVEDLPRLDGDDLWRAVERCAEGR